MSSLVSRQVKGELRVKEDVKAPGHRFHLRQSSICVIPKSDQIIYCIPRHLWIT